MKQKLLFFITIVLPLFCVNAQTARTLTPSEIYNAIVGSTVVVETNTGRGSGFYVAPNIIATNFHVIEGASEATAQITNTDIIVDIVGYLAVDKDADLILLQVTGTAQTPLRFARENTSIGEAIYAIGAPRGLSGTITDGIVSALRNDDGVHLVQISAPISPGSSGCPVVNRMGEVIGVAMGAIDGQNLNFAISRTHLQDLMKQRTATPQKINTLEPRPLRIETCNNTDTPDWGESLGVVSFVTNQTWKIGNIVWSDAVQASACSQKTNYFGGLESEGNFRSDCRSNPRQNGDLFSWCAVARFRSTLCPYPWRVPTAHDFIALDNALGGTGKHRNHDYRTRNLYLNVWGGTYSGDTDDFGILGGQGIWGPYWSLSEHNVYSASGHYLHFHTGGDVNPQASARKTSGFSLRCIR